MNFVRHRTAFLPHRAEGDPSWTTAITKAKALVTGVKRDAAWYVSRPDRLDALNAGSVLIACQDEATQKRLLKHSRAVVALHFNGKLDARSVAELERLTKVQPTLKIRALVAQAAKAFEGP